MCVSAEASFAAGSVLAVAGVATVRRALRYDRSMLVFSLFPAIFALHQFIEGAVWLSVDGVIDGNLFRYLYIAIAFLLWPVLTPFAAAFAEKDPRWRTARYFLFALGLMLGGYGTAKNTGLSKQALPAPNQRFFHLAGGAYGTRNCLTQCLRGIASEQLLAQGLIFA
jgi:hypothetical protein